MPTSVIPALTDALVAQARAALPSVSVYDGFGISDESGDFLMIGVEDPDSTDASYSVDASQSAATLGTSRSRDEIGEVSCVALSWNGNANQKAARDAAFATAAAVETLCRAAGNPAFGITGLRLVEYGSAQRLRQNQDSDGAEAAVFFSVRFRARI